jgi:hypothetical protein
MLRVTRSRPPSIATTTRSIACCGAAWCWLCGSCDSDDLGPAANVDTSGPSTSDVPEDAGPDSIPHDLPTSPPIDHAPFCRGAARADCPDAPFFPVPACVAPSCDDCTQLAELETLQRFDDARFVVVAADRSTLSRGREDAPIERHDAGGALLWSLAEPLEDVGLALAPWGDALVASRGFGDESGPKMTAIDTAGAVRWTTVLEEDARFDRVDTDGTRVLGAGPAAQLNTPEDRGFVASFTADGELQWSRKLVDVRQINALAFVGDDIIVYGDGISTAPRRLTRLDRDGATLWSRQVEWPEFGVVEAIADAGGGRTWLFGRRDDMPWGVTLDADGTVAHALECTFPTEPEPPAYYMPYGAATAAAVGDDGLVAVGVGTVGTHEAPWIAWLDDGLPVAARVLEGSSSVRQLRRDDQGELLAVMGFYDGDVEPPSWTEVLVVRQ